MTITAQQLAAGLRAFANALDPQQGSAATPQQGSTSLPGGAADLAAQAAAQQAAQVAAQQAAALQAGQAATPNVTDTQLVQLIQPHIGNEALKAELGNVMRSMGINNLPDAQPHQYGALYSAFQGVLARFGIGGSGAVSPQTNTSII